MSAQTKVDSGFPGTTSSSDGPTASGGLLAGKTAVVVGGGPAGMLAAMQLARQGASVQVFEGRPYNYDEGTNKWFIVLSDRGLAGLKAAGIDVQESPQSIRFAGLHVLGLDGRCNRLRPNKPHVEIMCTRGMLSKYVQDEARRLCPNISLRFECKLHSGDLEARKLEFDDLESGETFSVQADLLVGADGANSKIRGFMCEQVPGFSINKQPSYSSLCTVYLPKPPSMGEVGSHGKPFHMFPDGDDREQWLGKGNFLTFLTAKNGMQAKCGVLFNTFASGETICSFSMSNAAWERDFTEADIRDDLVSELPQLPASVVDAVVKVIVSSPELRPLPSSIMSSAISAPCGVLLVGDAAHTMSPALGFGANTAMEDSVYLQEAIEKSQGCIATLCEAYNDLRLEDSVALVDIDRDWWAMAAASPGSALSKLWAAMPMAATALLSTWTASLPARFRVQDPILLARLRRLKMSQVRPLLRRNTAIASCLALSTGIIMVSALLAVTRLVRV